MDVETMAGFRCWRAEDVSTTVFSDIGALSADADALFLAAHTPVQLEQRKGPEIVASSGELRVLKALVDGIGNQERNTLVAVTGASGSGKSHVVRWVHAHLPGDDPRVAVLYVPRAIQTLRELLKRIIDGLPEIDGNDLMSRIDAAISNVQSGELLDRLVNDIQVALDWSLEDLAPFGGETPQEASAREDRNSLLGVRDSATGRRRDGLGDLLAIPQVIASLQRPEGRLSSLVDSYFHKLSRRDADEQIFTPDDLPLRVKGVRSALAGRRDLVELWDVVRRQPFDALSLLEEALRLALPRTLGLRSGGGETLESLFLASRRALRTQGKELVLVFEDLAQFGLVDGALYDQFVTPPGDDLAPLRVVFAVTDGAYARLERTLRTRMTYEFHVGDSALSNPERFIARYLNLVRVGRSQTLALWDKDGSSASGSSPMVNACDTREEGRPCRFRGRCHSAFGSVIVEGLGEVGLYPYNQVAMDRALKRLGSDATPRAVLEACVSTNLIEADPRIEAAEYPHPRTAEQFDFFVHNAKDALLDRYPSPDPERYYRALVIWGNESPLPSGVLEAFSLKAEQGGGPVKPPPVEVKPRATVVDKPSPLLPLFQWQVGESLPEDDANYYRDTLRSLVVDRLQMDQLLIHIYSGRGKALLDDLFNVTSFWIEDARGRRARSESVHFELTRTPEDVRVLAAARWFRDHGHFDPSNGRWPWPDGYEPADLMVELEVRLDRWADSVRSRLLAFTGGAKLAQQAIGLRAVALVASGHSQGEVDTAAFVLSATAQRDLPPSPCWANVNREAIRVINSLPVQEYVGEFAAVRQGVSGKPQLVDPRALDEAVLRFLSEPEEALEDVIKSSGDPNLILEARKLLEGLTEAAGAEAATAADDYRSAKVALEGQDPASIGEWAHEVGRVALDAGFFRPVDGWLHYLACVERLKSEPALEDPAVANGEDIGAVLRAQHSVRRVHRLASDLAVVQNAMTATRRECERGGSNAGDAATLRTKVKGQAGQLVELVHSLGRETK